MSKKIKAIVKRPDEVYGHVTAISYRLENLQAIVGGWIETVPAWGGAIIICNEEGKLMGLPMNMPCGWDMLAGTIIAVGRDGEEFCDFPYEFAEWKKFVDMNWNARGGKA